MSSSTNKYSISFIMDASGSMESMGNEPWQSLNSFVKKQKESNVDFNFTLIFFNSEIKFLYKNIESDKIPELTDKDYNPMDTTSLYDAIGKGIEYQKSQSMYNVIFVILTDGLENSSREYNKKGIQKMIKDLETKNNWQFVYLGANQDSFQVGHGIGINTTCDYACTPEGLRGVMRSVSNSISRQISGETETIKLEENKNEENKNEENKNEENYLEPSSNKKRKYRSLRPPFLDPIMEPTNLDQTVLKKL